MFKQFDIVQIITTKSIRFLSGPEGQAADPHGNWQIVGFVGSDTILAKKDTLVRVPLGDVRRVGSYDLDNLYKKLSSAGYLKEESINMADHISNMLSINIAEARTLLLDNEHKLNVNTIRERNKITEKVKAEWLKRKKNT